MSSFDRIRASREAGAGGGQVAADSVEAQARATWLRNAAIRAEFLEEAHFVAYEKARAAGKFKVIHRPEGR